MSIPSSKYFTVGNGNKQLSWNQFSSFFPFYVFLPTTAKLITQKHCFLHFSALLEYLQHGSPKCLHQSFWSYLAKLFLRASNFSHIVLISVLQIRLPTSHSLMFPAWNTFLLPFLSTPILFFFQDPAYSPLSSNSSLHCTSMISYFITHTYWSLSSDVHNPNLPIKTINT